jgi:molybdopterin-biosynthesis enzyme MoeA-like protein
MKSIFGEEIEPNYLAGGSALVMRELRLHFAVEGRFWPVLKELEETHPDVAVGSYPNFDTNSNTFPNRKSDTHADTNPDAGAASRRRRSNLQHHGHTLRRAYDQCHRRAA